MQPGAGDLVEQIGEAKREDALPAQLGHQLADEGGLLRGRLRDDPLPFRAAGEECFGHIDAARIALRLSGTQPRGQPDQIGARLERQRGVQQRWVPLQKMSRK